MISPDPHMSDQLFNDCLEHALDNDTQFTVDELMVRYWDEVSDAVLLAAKNNKTTPQYIIEEFCVDSDWPDEPIIPNDHD